MDSSWFASLPLELLDSILCELRVNDILKVVEAYQGSRLAWIAMRCQALAHVEFDRKVDSWEKIIDFILLKPSLKSIHLCGYTPQQINAVGQLCLSYLHDVTFKLNVFREKVFWPQPQTLDTRIDGAILARTTYLQDELVELTPDPLPLLQSYVGGIFNLESMLVLRECQHLTSMSLELYYFLSTFLELLEKANYQGISFGSVTRLKILAFPNMFPLEEFPQILSFLDLFPNLQRVDVVSNEMASIRERLPRTKINFIKEDLLCALSRSRGDTKWMQFEEMEEEEDDEDEEDEEFHQSQSTHTQT